MEVSPNDHIQQQIFWYGYYEKEYALTFESFVQKNSVVFDIGANAGYYSLITATKAIEGQVFSFEPYSIHFEELGKNIGINKLKNIFPIKLAVSDKEEESQLFISDDTNSGMTGLNAAKNFSGQIEKIKTILLDNWMKKQDIQRIDCIKIDIEGAEYFALAGMKDILQNFKPVLFIEIANELLHHFGHNATDIYTLLQGHGYTPYQVMAVNNIRKINTRLEDNLILFLPNNYDIPASITVQE